MKLYFSLLLCFCTTFISGQAYEVNVHPGQEVVTIIQILAGKYPAPNKSNYEQAMHAHFESFTEHPAVNHLRNISGQIYSDFPETGWCFARFPAFDLHLPEESLWYDQYGRDTVQEFLRLAVNFAQESDFWSFYQAHRNEYSAWAKAITVAIDSQQLISRLDNLYNGGNQPRFYIAMDPLNSWGAHAIPNVAEFNPVYAKYKAYSVGYWNRESTEIDSPSFTEGNYLTNLVWHEGSHIYLDPFLEIYKDEIANLSYLFNKTDRNMQNQNIDSWAYCFEENLVRGIVIHLSKMYLSPRNWRKARAREVLNDFLYAEAIAEWLEKNYQPKSNGGDFEAVIPALLPYLKARFPTIPD